MKLHRNEPGSGRWEAGDTLPDVYRVAQKKCINSLLINIFGINLNEISISGWECNIMLSLCLCHLLSKNYKSACAICWENIILHSHLEIEISFKFIPKILMSKECIHFLGHSVYIYIFFFSKIAMLWDMRKIMVDPDHRWQCKVAHKKCALHSG